MTQATINGNTYSDDGSAAKDMNNGGHRTHFLPLVNDVVTVAGQVAADKATVATDKATAATASVNATNKAAEATQRSSDALASAGVAVQAKQDAEAAKNSAVAVVTGGTASLNPAAGKIPIADADGRINAEWIRQQTNDIGTPGTLGFGVGIAPSIPSGYSVMTGTTIFGHDNYGNYQYSDGSVMVWVPAFFYKYGTGNNGLTLNAVDIKPFSAYATVADANAAGFALHRAFYDGGAVKQGFFFDKYITSNNGGIASSLKNGIVLTSGQRGSLSTAVYSALTGAPANNLGGSIAAAKTRGANFFAASQFQRGALALLAYAHGKASTSTTYCAWYHATNNFPKGNNNNALGDAQDSAILYVADGNGTYPGCGKTGSANLFARTTHNGQNSGIADLNGLVWEFSPGMTSDGTNLYMLNTSVAMKNVTGGSGGATDLFGAAGIAAMYTSLGATYQSLVKQNGWVYTGNAAAQVLSEATSGNDWALTGFGVPKLGGTGGTNAFGNDGVYQPSAWPNELAPLSGAGWTGSSGAGVWALRLTEVRADSSYSIGFRSALYL